MRTKSPQGDRFNDTEMYIPWNSGQTVLSSAAIVSVAQGVYGEAESNLCVVKGVEADYDTYQSHRESFMAYGTDLDLRTGPGNSGNNMSFEHLHSFDLNTYV